MIKISNKTAILKYAYALCVIVNWSSRLLPYTATIVPNWSLPPGTLDIRYNLGFGLFIGLDFSWIGMFINIAPVLQLHRSNKRMAFIYGVIACVLIGVLQSIYLIMNSMLAFNPYTLVYGFYIGLLSYISCWCLLIVLLFFLKDKERDFEKEPIIKKTILEFGTFITRLKVREISELTGADQEIIIEVIKSMIHNNEIYARYYKSSTCVVFNRRENMDKIDDLMDLYNEWERENIGKIETGKNNTGA